MINTDIAENPLIKNIYDIGNVEHKIIPIIKLDSLMCPVACIIVVRYVLILQVKLLINISIVNIMV